MAKKSQQEQLKNDAEERARSLLKNDAEERTKNLLCFPG